MSKEAYDAQTLTQYLLGASRAAEGERLDELSLTDSEFAAGLRAAENDLVDAYVRGELAGETLEKFRSHYLASPRRRERVEFAHALRRLTEKGAGPEGSPGRTGTRAEVAAAGRGARRLPSTGFFGAPRPALQWGAVCAALALLVLGGWLAFENARLRGQVAETQASREAAGRREQELRRELDGQRAAGAGVEQELAQERAERERLAGELRQQTPRAEVGRTPSAPGAVSIASLTLTPQLRGSGQFPTVKVPARAGYVSTRLDLEPNDYTAFRVTLIDPDGNQALWRSGALTARVKGETRYLSLRLRAGLLKPRAYALRVEGVSASGVSEIVGDYPFRVMK